MKLDDLTAAYEELTRQHLAAVKLLADVNKRLAYYEEHVESIRYAKEKRERRLIVLAANDN